LWTEALEKEVSSGEADRQLLVRLTGLLPTPEEERLLQAGAEKTRWLKMI
jgi:hypothetical protein